MAKAGRPRQFDKETAIDVAMNTFWEKGFESTSLADLREVLNLSSASFYAAFGSKKKLFEACLERYAKTCGEMTSYLDDSSVSGREAMQNMLNATIRVQTSNTSPLGCMAVLSGQNCLDSNKDVEALAARVRLETKEAICRCLQRAAREGELPDTTDIDAMTLMFDCFVKGISVQARDGVTEQALLHSVECLMHCWPHHH